MYFWHGDEIVFVVFVEMEESVAFAVYVYCAFEVDFGSDMAL